MHISLIIEAIKVLCWANNAIDLPVCTFFGSELATEIRAEPIMLNKCPYYAQTMLIKCDPHSENQPFELFQVRLGGVYFHNFSMLADIGPLPYKV